MLDEKQCKVCGGKMELGQAMVPMWGGIPDFIGEKEVVTLCQQGARLASVMKCTSCGHSYRYEQSIAQPS